MAKNAMRADLSRQMEKRRIPHIGKAGTPDCLWQNSAKNKSWQDLCQK